MGFFGEGHLSKPRAGRVEPQNSPWWGDGGEWEEVNSLLGLAGIVLACGRGEIRGKEAACFLDLDVNIFGKNEKF